MELLYLDGPTFMRELGYYVVFIPSVGLFIASNNLTLWVDYHNVRTDHFKD